MTCVPSCEVGTGKNTNPNWRLSKQNSRTPTFSRASFNTGIVICGKVWKLRRARESFFSNNTTVFFFSFDVVFMFLMVTQCYGGSCNILIYLLSELLFPLSTTEKWVAAGRRFDHGDSDTNIPVENLWKVLKYVFLERRVNLRPGLLLDKLLGVPEARHASAVAYYERRLRDHILFTVWHWRIFKKWKHLLLKGQCHDIQWFFALFLCEQKMATARASVADIWSWQLGLSREQLCRSSWVQQMSFCAALPWGRHYFSPHKMAAKNHRLSWHCRFKQEPSVAGQWLKKNSQWKDQCPYAIQYTWLGSAFFRRFEPPRISGFKVQWDIHYHQQIRIFKKHWYLEYCLPLFNIFRYRKVKYSKILPKHFIFDKLSFFTPKKKKKHVKIARQGSKIASCPVVIP